MNFMKKKVFSPDLPEQVSSKGFTRVEIRVERVLFYFFNHPFDVAFDAALSRFAQSVLREIGFVNQDLWLVKKCAPCFFAKISMV
jgi:hypothetical protein